MALILVAGTYLLCERILALAGYFHPIVASILSGIGVFTAWREKRWSKK